MIAPVFVAQNCSSRDVPPKFPNSLSTDRRSISGQFRHPRKVRLLVPPEQQQILGLASRSSSRKLVRAGDFL